MLNLAFAQITQPRRPLPILHQIIRHVLGEEDVPGIAAIHHPLRHVDPGPGEVGAPAHVGHFAHRPAVNAHPDRNFRMLPERLGDFERAPRRLFRAVAKDQRHPIAGRQPNELFVGRVAHLRRPEHDFRQLVEALLLFLDQELGVTDDVDEQDMSDLEPKIVLRFRGHAVIFTGLASHPRSFSAIEDSTARGFRSEMERVERVPPSQRD